MNFRSFHEGDELLGILPSHQPDLMVRFIAFRADVVHPCLSVRWDVMLLFEVLDTLLKGRGVLGFLGMPVFFA